MEKFESKAKALNLMHTALNGIVPELQRDIKENGYKLKTDLTLFKKDANRLKAIIDKHANKKLGNAHITAFISPSEYGLWLKVQARAGNVYVDEELSLRERYAPRPEDITGEDVEAAGQKIRELKDEKSAIDGRIFELTNSFKIDARYV